MLHVFDEVFIICDSDAHLSDAIKKGDQQLMEKCVLCVEEASLHRTEQLSGISALC